MRLEVGARGLRAGLVLRALVDDLAVVHVQLARVHGLSTRDGLHMEVLRPHGGWPVQRQIVFALRA